MSNLKRYGFADLIRAIKTRKFSRAGTVSAHLIRNASDRARQGFHSLTALVPSGRRRPLRKQSRPKRPTQARPRKPR